MGMHQWKRLLTNHGSLSSSSQHGRVPHQWLSLLPNEPERQGNGERGHFQSLYWKRYLENEASSADTLINNSTSYIHLDYDYLSNGKMIGLFIALQVAAILSMLGSCLVLYLVLLKRREKVQKRRGVSSMAHPQNSTSSGGNNNSIILVENSSPMNRGNIAGASQVPTSEQSDARRDSTDPILETNEKAPVLLQQNCHESLSEGAGTACTHGCGDSIEPTSTAVTRENVERKAEDLNESRRITRISIRQRPSSHSSTNGNVENVAAMTLYDRMVMGLVVTDLIVTLSMWVMPFTSYQGHYSVGNYQTCAATAFFFQLYIASYVYNAELSFYFLMTVRYGKKEAQLKRWLEPAVHIIPFTISVISGISGLATESFNPSLLVGSCDYNPYPANCVPSGDERITNEPGKPLPPPCERGSMAESLSQLQNSVLYLSVIIGIVSTWLVYWTVRQKTLRVQRRFNRSMELTTGTAASPNVTRRRRGWRGRRSHGEPVDIQQELQLLRVRSVAVQCMCFTAVYMNGFIVGLFLAVIDAVFTTSLVDSSELTDNPWIYLAVFLVVFFFALMGFLNCCIYIRPAVVQWKIADPKHSWSFAFRQVLQGHPPPPDAMMAYLRRKHAARKVEESTIPLPTAAINASTSQKEYESIPHASPAFVEGDEDLAVGDGVSLPLERDLNSSYCCFVPDAAPENLCAEPCLIDVDETPEERVPTSGAAELLTGDGTNAANTTGQGVYNNQP